MGSCLCRREQIVAEGTGCFIQLVTMACESESSKRPKMSKEALQMLINDVLRYITNCTGLDEEDPVPLVRIKDLADTEQGWCDVMDCLIHSIPLKDPVGPSAIAVIFDFIPLPAGGTVLKFLQSLKLNCARTVAAFSSAEQTRQERNLLFLLACIAEKFASNSSVQILTENMIGYLVAFLFNVKCPVMALEALVVLEKLSASAEIKKLVEEAMQRTFLHPLLLLEQRPQDSELAWRCLHFAAQWSLDNIFIQSSRPFTFEHIDNEKVTVMLNNHDMSGCLKLGADGLEVRSDSLTFESIRATFKITSGCWYYEAQILTSGVMQIGWATKDTKFDNHDGYGVGDDEYSIAYDGCRRLVWHSGRTNRIYFPEWHAGDVVGCLVDTYVGEVVFSVNGIALPTFKPLFVSRFAAASKGFYPAASFMANQQCVFNFGARPFCFPPTDRVFQVLNNSGRLTEFEKMVIPRRIDQLLIESEEDTETTSQHCIVCLDAEGDYGIGPCNHSGMCSRCVVQLDECPLCRGSIENIYLVPL